MVRRIRGGEGEVTGLTGKNTEEKKQEILEDKLAEDPRIVDLLWYLSFLELPLMRSCSIEMIILKVAQVDHEGRSLTNGRLQRGSESREN